MKKEVIALFKKNPNQAFKSRDVGKKLNIFDEDELDSLKVLMFKLYEEGILTRNGKKYKLNRNNGNESSIESDIQRSKKGGRRKSFDDEGTRPPREQRRGKLVDRDVVPGNIKGVLQVTKVGFGFVIVKDKNIKGDIFIAQRNIGTAFNGDIVEVSLFAKQRGKNIEGQIEKVIKRKREELVGTLHKSKAFYFVTPDDSDIDKDIYVDPEHLNGALEGQKVIVGEIDWSDRKLNPEGVIVEVIGKPGSIDAEVVSIAKDFDLPYKFDNATLEEANNLTSEIPLEELEKRIDFRSKNVFTIDPADAKDFDDALSIENLENGNYRIGIHIADVAHYVNLKSSIDKEAEQRGNSVYLVGKVIPMIPENLSTNICSLVPYEDRLTYSCIVEITKRGKVESYQLAKTVINSKRRYNYDEVQEIIDNEKGDFVEELLTLNAIATNLRKKRMREGSIDFSSTEVKFELDENNKPIGIYKKEIKESNMLIEEFMLLANKIVAKHIAVPGHRRQPPPFVYRIHDLPDPEKLEDFSKFVKTLGYHFNPHAKAKTNQLQALMEEVKGKEEEAVISELAIRSMAKAIYSTNNIGHYGLGFQYYTHFTSPIRRYSDLLVHRLLFQYNDKDGKPIYNQEHLESICDHISITERSAVDAERYSVKLKQVEYLKDKVGDQFEAIVSGVTPYGLFVKLVDILAEGLIKLRDLQGDLYVFDEKKFALIGRIHKKQYRFGDKLKVQLIRVDTEKLEIDFTIID